MYTSEQEINGWQEWSKYVLKELERLNACTTELTNKNSALMVELAETKLKFSNEITRLKVKSGTWGLLGGAIPVAIMLAVKYLSG